MKEEKEEWEKKKKKMENKNIRIWEGWMRWG